MFSQSLNSLPYSVNFRTFSTDKSKEQDDVNEESHSDFQSKSKVSSDDAKLKEMVDTWVKENDVVLFMKGNKKMPRCGFSNYVVQVLKFYGLNFKDVDVL